MGRVPKVGQMGPNIRDSGWMIKLLVMACFGMLIKISIKVTSLKAKLMGKANILKKMVKSMKGIGPMINLMAKAGLSRKMDLSLMVNIIMDKCLDMESTCGQISQLIKVFGKTTSSTATVNTNGTVAADTSVNGKITSCTGKEKCSTKMVVLTKETSNQKQNMVTVFTL